VAGLLAIVTLNPVEARASLPPFPQDFTLCKPAPMDGLRSFPEIFSLSISAREEQASSSGREADPEARLKKRWGRAMLQTGLFLGYSTIRYWLAYKDFVEDWQYELTWKDQIRRFFTTEALRFDSNCFSINWTHGLAGALYYQIARANRLTWLESVLVSMGGSLFYEYIGEWREVISINDMIVTSIGAYSLGEPWFQLGRYFHHRKSFFPRVLGFLNPFVEFNQWLDRKDPASKIYIDPDWHEFEIWAGWRRFAREGRAPLDSAWAGFDMQMIHQPGYGRPGVFRRTFRDTAFSELIFDMALRNRLPGDAEARSGLDEEVYLFGRVVGWGSYRQEIDELSRARRLLRARLRLQLPEGKARRLRRPGRPGEDRPPARGARGLQGQDRGRPCPRAGPRLDRLRPRLDAAVGDRRLLSISPWPAPRPSTNTPGSGGSRG
jgi:hypothetical protein